jgi:hypothetical protein
MYQPNPPTIPSFGTDWIAVDIKEVDTNGLSYQTLKGDILTLQGDLVLNVSLAIYGANSFSVGMLIKAGMELTQNSEILRKYNIAFGEYGRLLRVPELHNQRWLERYNLDFTLNYLAVNDTSITTITSVKDIKINSNQ